MRKPGAGCLMVERVHRQHVIVGKQARQNGARFHAHRVRGIGAVQLLTVLDALRSRLRADVLIEFAAQGCGHHLDAPAYAQHGNLAVGCQAREQQLLTVATVVDAMQLLHRLLAQKERIDVTPAREQDAVHALQRGEQRVALFIRGDDEGDASGTQHGRAVAVGQRTIPVTEVGSHSNDGQSFISGV